MSPLAKAGSDTSDYEWTHIKKKGFTSPNKPLSKRSTRSSKKTSSESRTSQDKPTNKKRARSSDTSEEFEGSPAKKAKTTRTTRTTRSSTKTSDETNSSQEKPKTQKRVRISDTSDEFLGPPQRNVRTINGMKVKAARSSTDSQETLVLKSALKKPSPISSSDIEYEPTPKKRARIAPLPPKSKKRATPDDDAIEYEYNPRKRLRSSAPPKPVQPTTNTNTQRPANKGAKSSLLPKKSKKELAAERAQAKKDADYKKWKIQRDIDYERSFFHFYGCHSGDINFVRTETTPKWTGVTPAYRLKGANKRVFHLFEGIEWKRKTNGLRKVDKSKIILTATEKQAIIDAEEEATEEAFKLQEKQMEDYRKWLVYDWKVRREKKCIAEGTRMPYYSPLWGPQPPSEPWVHIKPNWPESEMMYDDERGVVYRRWPDEAGWNSSDESSSESDGELRRPEN